MSNLKHIDNSHKQTSSKEKKIHDPHDGVWGPLLPCSDENSDTYIDDWMRGRSVPLICSKKTPPAERNHKMTPKARRSTQKKHLFPPKETPIPDDALKDSHLFPQEVRGRGAGFDTRRLLDGRRSDGFACALGLSSSVHWCSGTGSSTTGARTWSIPSSPRRK